MLPPSLHSQIYFSVVLLVFIVCHIVYSMKKKFKWHLLRENGKKCKQFGNEIHTEEQAQHKKAQYIFLYTKVMMEGCGAGKKMLVKKYAKYLVCHIESVLLNKFFDVIRTDDWPLNAEYRIQKKIHAKRWKYVFNLNIIQYGFNYSLVALHSAVYIYIYFYIYFLKNYLNACYFFQFSYFSTSNGIFLSFFSGKIS